MINVEVEGLECFGYQQTFTGFSLQSLRLCVRPVFFDLSGMFCYDAVNLWSSGHARAQRSPGQEEFHKKIFTRLFSFLNPSLSLRSLFFASLREPR